MLKTLSSFDGLSDTKFQLGDIPALKEVVPATIVTNAITLTGAILMQTIVQRTITGAGTPTIDTAANIVNVLQQQYGASNIDNGTSWRVKWINNAAYADTLTAVAHQGITLTNGVVNASSVKEFLVQVTCGADAITAPNCIITNASAVVTLATALGQAAPSTNGFAVGQVVTNAQNGLQDATIVSIQPNVGFTMSTTATSGQTTQVALNLSPTL